MFGSDKEYEELKKLLTDWDRDMNEPIRFKYLLDRIANFAVSGHSEEKKIEINKLYKSIVSKYESQSAENVGSTKFKNLFKDYTPENLIEQLEKRRDIGGEYRKGVGVWEGYSLKRHTLMVLGQFEKYYGDKPLPGSVDKNFFRLILALHDIGKPRAAEEGDKTGQYMYTPEIIEKVLKDFGCDEKDINLATMLLGEDFIGKCVKSGESNIIANLIRSTIRDTDVSVKDFLELLLIYYKVDAGSYTLDAGGIESLDRLFIFDHEKREIDFSNYSKPQIEKLKRALGLI